MPTDLNAGEQTPLESPRLIDPTVEPQQAMQAGLEAIQEIKGVEPNRAAVQVAEPFSPAIEAAEFVKPIEAAKPIEVTKPAIDLSQELQAAGLEWVQTDPTKTPIKQPAPSAPILGRKPRRSEAISAPEELVMVETRNHE